MSRFSSIETPLSNTMDSALCFPRCSSKELQHCIEELTQIGVDSCVESSTTALALLALLE